MSKRQTNEWQKKEYQGPVPDWQTFGNQGLRIFGIDRSVFWRNVSKSMKQQIGIVYGRKIDREEKKKTSRHYLFGCLLRSRGEREIFKRHRLKITLLTWWAIETARQMMRNKLNIKIFLLQQFHFKYQIIQKRL